MTPLGRWSQRVRRREIKLLGKYARLAEHLGTEAISQGVDAQLLPADKATLRDIIIRAAQQPAMVRKLQAEDLPKLYGMLAFFLEPRDLEAVRAAASLAAAGDHTATLSESEQQILADGSTVQARAVHAFHESSRWLRSTLAAPE